VKGTKLGVQTNADGNFKIKVPASATTLVISSIGYAGQEIAIADESLSIKMVQQSKTDELVVVAYGTRKKTDLTGSVTAVSAKDFQKGAISSPEQLLQGKVPGLQITSGGGQPGGGSLLRIRGQSSINGSSDPLIVIDGIPVASGNSVGGSANNLLSTIDPNDIESMSVLKDASATAMYGSRASGGVIIITTKKGSKGKIKFNYNAQLSLGNVAKEESVLSGDQIRSIINADAASSGINTWKNLLGTNNTDWQKQIYQNSVGFDNNISASGAIKNIPFRVSLGYLDQTGVLLTDKFNRVTTSVNLSPKFLHDDLAVNVNFKYSHNSSRFADQNAIGSAVNFDPTQPIHQQNVYGGNFEWLTAAGIPINTNGGSVQPNPLSMLNFRNHTGNLDRYLGNVQLDYKLKFFPDLHVLVNVGVDNAINTEQDIQNTNLVTTHQAAFSGSRYHFLQGNQNYLADVSLYYAKELKKLKGKIDVLVLHSYQDIITNVYNNPTYGTSSSTGSDTTISSPITNPTDKPELRIESYLSRINFSFANYYLLTASVRSDAVSRFAPDKRVGYFPSAAAAWKLKDEFFKNTTVLSDLKLRVGVGKTGQQDIGSTNYYYEPNYYQSVNAAAQYQFGSTFYSFSRPTAYNPNLTWESTTTYNLGVDYGFLKNRITGNVEVYDKKTSGLLFNVAVAPGSNFDVQEYENIGSMESKGVEFAINTIPVKNKDLTWELGFNIAYNKSQITDLGGRIFQVGGVSGGTGGTIGILQAGNDPSSFYVQKQIYNANGTPIQGLYQDINRDGVINAADYTIFKKANPDYLFGFTTQVMYKKYSLGLAAHGALGNYLYNNYNAAHGFSQGNGGIENPLSFIQNGSSDYMNTKFTSPQWYSNYYIENASYFRLDNINFGYNVGKILKNKASLRITASCQNVFVITKYSGMDPENSSTNGIDNNIYPRPRVFTLGASLDF